MGYSKSMTTNIYKVLICCFLLIGNFVKGQELIDTGDNLDVNGEVYTVKVLNENSNTAIIAGDFNEINGISGFHNIALVNLANFTVSSIPGITSINGPIHDVALDRRGVGLAIMDKIYIGGNFTQINGVTKNYLALFERNIFSPSFDYILSSWDPGINGQINDIEKLDDTLYYSGSFTSVNNGLSLDDNRFGLSAISLVTGLDLNIFRSNQPCNANIVYVNEIDVTSKHVNVSGKCNAADPTGGLFFRFSKDGCLDVSFGGHGGTYFPPSGYLGEAYDIVTINDSIYYGIESSSGTLESWVFTDDFTDFSSGFTVFDKPLTSSVISDFKLYPTPTPSGISFEPTSVAKYKNRLFVIYDYSYTGGIYPIFGTITSVDTGGTNWQSYGMTEKFTDPFLEHAFVVKNVLFVSRNGTLNYTDAGSPMRSGLITYCLEPSEPEFFTSYDTTICPGDTLNYEIPIVQYADGYLWEFSGSGVNLGAISGGPDLLTTETTSNSINIAFSSNFEAGFLTVTPFSTCNNLLYDDSNKQYSSSQTIYIDTNPLPDVYAGLDTTLTCRRTSVLLEGFSSTPGVTYEWIQPGPYNTVGTDTIATTDGEYVFQVTDALGCPNFDTVIVSLDTIKPDVILPLGPLSITCSDTVRNLLGSTSITDSLLFWRKVSSMDSLSNPVSANGLGEYRLIVEDTINGCRDSAAVFMFLDQTPPNILVSGYPDLAAGGYLDTINCYFPNLLLNAHSDSINAVINWCNEDSTNFVGTDTLIENGGWFYLFAEDTVKGCTNYGKVLIFEDFGQPDVSINSTTALNCSNDSLILNATTLVGDTLIWTGSLIPSSSNPLTVFDPGWYFITAIDSLNGCSRLDSIEIIADNSIDVMAGNDTIACNQELIPFSASYIGSISGITYAWNNGSTDALSFYTAGLDSVIVVEINGDGGCYGTDTVRMDIPPIPVIEFTGYQPCGDGPTGQIVGDPLSGFAPFTYSIDGGITYQTTPVFTGLGFGTYPIWVKDSLSCDYEFEAIIDQSSALPEPEFLFSTYNFATDTVVIIDVSNPPTDSTTWDFPTELMVLDSNALSPMLLLPDTGSFEIIMHAWYGTCEVITSKLIYASPFDSSSASFYNQNGIKSIELYPNPTTGEFTVNIEFYKSQRAAISLQDMLGYSYAFYSYDETAFISELITMDAAALNGTYVLKVVSEFDSAAITFILSR